MKTLALGLLTFVIAGSAFAQDIRTVPTTTVPAALYCGNFDLTVYTGNAGNPATEFRAGDNNAGMTPQRYIIDPGVNGTIGGAWIQPASGLADLAQLAIMRIAPLATNNRLVVLELLAVPEPEPGRVDLVVHIACRPGG